MYIELTRRAVAEPGPHVRILSPPRDGSVWSVCFCLLEEVWSPKPKLAKFAIRRIFMWGPILVNRWSHPPYTSKKWMIFADIIRPEKQNSAPVINFPPLLLFSRYKKEIYQMSILRMLGFVLSLLIFSGNFSFSGWMEDDNNVKINVFCFLIFKKCIPMHIFNFSIMFFINEIVI